MKQLAKLSLVLFFGAYASMSQAAFIEGAILFSNFNWTKDGTTLSVDSPQISGATGDFVGQGNPVINDLDYSPFSALDPLWTTDDFSFAINFLTIVFEDADDLTLKGSGVVSGTGFDDTWGTWSFTGGTINWSSSTSIPEPGVLALVALGLLGMRISFRRK